MKQPLPHDHRKILETTVAQARSPAEDGAEKEQRIAELRNDWKDD